MSQDVVLPLWSCWKYSQEIFFFFSVASEEAVPSEFDKCTSSFHQFVSFCVCECWHLQDMMLHFKLLRHSRSPTELPAGSALKIQRPHATFPTCLLHRPDLELASRSTQKEENSDSGSSAEGSNYWVWLTMLQFHFCSLLSNKDKITIVSSKRTAKNSFICGNKAGGG